MRTLPYKLLALAMLLALPVSLAANTDYPKGKYTKEKNIKKEFSVSPDALLKIDNSYGNLNITSWDQNTVVIEVHIETSGNDEDRVQEKLDNISVDFEANNGMVSARTDFDSHQSSWWRWGKSNVNMQVNYNIKVPVKNSVNLSNDYGSIILDRIDGYAKISCDYGRLDIGELRGRNNQLSFDYTSKSNIGYMNSGQISADYSGFTIEKAGDITLSADYTNSTIRQMESLHYSSDYGSLEVGEAKNIEGGGDYINVKLGTIHGNVDISADYGSINIDNMAADAGNINIRTDYTGVKIGYNPNYHFNFEISTEYAGVGGKEDFEVNVSMEKSQEKFYKGYHGSDNSGNMVNIKSEYGSVNFKQN